MTEPAPAFASGPIPIAERADLTSAMQRLKAGSAYADGPLVVTRNGCGLSPYCVVCAAPATRVRTGRRSQWVTSAKIVSNVRVDYGLCEEHAAIRWREPWVIGMVATAGIVTEMLIRTNGATLFLTLMALLLIAIFRWRSVLKFERVEPPWVWLSGAGEAYLQTLPPFNTDDDRVQ